MAEYSKVLQEVLHYGRELAVRYRSKNVAPDHLLLALLKVRGSTVRQVLDERMRVDLDRLQTSLSSYIQERADGERDDSEPVGLSREAKQVFHDAYHEAVKTNSMLVTEIHLLLGILLNEDEHACRLLREMDVDYQAFRLESRELDPNNGDEGSDERSRLSHEGDSLGGLNREEEEEDDSRFSFKDYCVNLTELARRQKLDHVVGRADELARMEQILCRRRKNNVVLIGEPGVGKTALVEGLAQKIANGDVPLPLRDKEIVQLDMAAMVAGTKYRGEFENRMKGLVETIKKNPNIIVFMDELHTLVGMGSASGSLDGANILKPALSRGEIQVIGATTLDEYRERIENDGALERRFQSIMVEPMGDAETVELLQSVSRAYEVFHNVRYTPEALRECVTLTTRYVTGREQPDKAIDALDETGARVALRSQDKPPTRVRFFLEQIQHCREELQVAEQDGNTALAEDIKRRKLALTEDMEQALGGWEEARRHNAPLVEAHDVADTVALMANLPLRRVEQTEGERLLNLEQELKNSVIGQDEAVGVVARAIRRNRSGMRDPKRPIGTFLFLGPTGVGKTYLAQELADYLFGGADNLIRVDMGEFQQGFNVSRLIGPPPGYLGYNEGGQLTERVRRHPYSVVLFDEIEKASPEVYNLLLQMLDEGRMADAKGRKVNFRNTVIIMTSNVGSRELSEYGDGVGFLTQHRKSVLDQDRQRFITKALERRFPPEFLNRVDELVYFNSLNPKAMERILEVNLRRMEAQLSEEGVAFDLSKSAREFVLSQSFDTKYGARPLRRALQRYVEDTLAEILLRQRLQRGNRVLLDYNEEKGMYAEVEGLSPEIPESRKALPMVE